MRGLKPAGCSGAGERAARSLDRVSRRRGLRRAAGASLEHKFFGAADVRSSQQRSESRSPGSHHRCWAARQPIEPRHSAGRSPVPLLQARSPARFIKLNFGFTGYVTLRYVITFNLRYVTLRYVTVRYVTVPGAILRVTQQLWYDHSFRCVHTAYV